MLILFIFKVIIKLLKNLKKPDRYDFSKFQLDLGAKDIL
jgi:hypothetical protein